MDKSWDKFLLLTWKNWLLQWRHPIQTVVEILAPVIFSALLVLIRSLVDPEKHADGQIFQPYALDDSAEIFKLNTTVNNLVIKFDTIYWSPCGNVAIEEIMRNIESKYNFTGDCRPNSELLEVEMRRSLNGLAGFQFDDSLSNQEGLNPTTHVTLRFPAELRSLNRTVFSNHWTTALLFPLYQIAGPRDFENNFGASPDYFNEGFLTLQREVSEGIIRHFKRDAELPQVLMQRFPYPSWINDPILTALESFVGIIIMLSFVYTCINTVKVITTEKEKQLKEAMKIMGLPNWLHWTAWFVKIFFFLLISIILMVVLLKVQWYPGTDFSVFTMANPFVMLLFLVFYMCATITFCFVISVFFSKANTAATIAGLAWFLSYCPYMFLQEHYSTLSLAEKLLACLASNTAMAYGFQLMLTFEGVGEGLQWHNMFTPVTPDDDLTLGYVMIMLIADTFIYLVIALYVEAVFPGDYGIPQVWYFPFTKSYWCGQPRYIGVEDASDEASQESDVYEREPTNLKPGIKIKHLRKVYSNKKVAVRDFSLNMFEDQITVLLGHNGAGKTTTMSMLTGLYPPTSGTAIVNGYDIRSDMVRVRDSLGLCPQHNILFDELTVSEHLYFFSELKGLSGKEIKNEVNKYIQLLELVPKANAAASTLSGGMKRKLCVAMALCGKSKICMFDEPTAGMDPSARRALWDLLQLQKKDRTILLSTHFMDEADLLGDRIAIMAGGQLQCCGSSFFLKKKYGAGYHLIMDKSSKTDVDAVTNLLKVHLPNIKVETNIGSELTYILSEDQSAIFEEMLSDLENNSEQLGINSYGVSLTTLEEVFMKVGADHGQEEENDALELLKPHKDVFNDQNGHHHTSETKLNIYEKEFLTGFPLWRNQFIAMMMKRVLSTFRSWILFLIQNLIPVAFLIIAIVVTRVMNQAQELPDFTFTLDSYDNPVTVMGTDNFSDPYHQAYFSLIESEGRQRETWTRVDFSENMINRTRENVVAVRLRHIIGATFEPNNITSWFNNDPFHSPPLALQYVMNAILRQTVGPTHSITFSNHPLPFNFETQFTQLSQGNQMGFQLAFNIGFSMAFVGSFYVLFFVKERVNKSKHLQFVSGIEVSTFWLTSYLWDFCTFVFTSLCLIATLACFQEDGFKTGEDIGRVFALLLFFGFAMLPLMYLSSFIFEIPATGFTRMTLINLFTGVAAFMVIEVLGFEGLDLEDVANALHWVFLLVPLYALTSAVNSMYLIFSVYNICQTINDLAGNFNVTFVLTDQDPACMQFPDSCCDIQTDYFSWTGDGVGRNVTFMSIIGIILTSILMMLEYRLFEKLIYMVKKATNKVPPAEETQDSDVLEEKRKVKAGEIRPDKTTLVLRDVSKYYESFLAVNRLSLGINNYECFGLLGINGAGKTSTFKMMTGDVKISYGDAWINGLALTKDMKKAQKFIGYCPQFDALLDDLTGKETLIMYCLLRGISLNDSKYVAEVLAKDFDFYRHINKQVKEYSGGNKRKLSAAIALIGDPPVIFLDEPTTGMDPATKRNLWNTLCRIRDSGKCLVLTSHSMEECEVLCTRLAIMVNGVFKCLGSTQHLKNKFSQGYTLTIKVRKETPATPTDDFDIAPIEQFIKSKFPSAILREKHQELITFYIPDISLPWSKMFGIMERGKKSLNIEDYSLGQSSLEQVFLSFAKTQRE